MTLQRCGFLPRSEWHPDATPDELGGEALDVCPAWYWSEPAVLPALHATLNLEASGVQLTREDPAPLIEAFGTIRGARRLVEANAWKEAKQGD